MAWQRFKQRIEVLQKRKQQDRTHPCRRIINKGGLSVWINPTAACFSDQSNETARSQRWEVISEGGAGL